MNEKKRNKENNYKPYILDASVNIGVSLGASGYILKNNARLYEKKKITSNDFQYISFLKNKEIDLYHKIQTTNNRKEIKKLRSELKKIQKEKEKMGGSYFSLFKKEDKEIDKNKDLYNEFVENVNRFNKKLDNLKLKQINLGNKLMIGGAATALGGLGYYAYNKFKNNSLLKTSFYRNNYNDKDKDEELRNLAASEITKDKQSLILPTGAAMLGGGFALERLSKKMGQMEKATENKYKTLMANYEINKNKRKEILDQIAKLESKKILSKEEKIELQRLRQAEKEFALKANQSIKQATNKLIGIVTNPSASTAKLANHLKWSSIPFLGYGAYQTFINKDKKVNADTAEKMNQASNLLKILGIGLIGVGTIRPMADSFAKHRKLLDAKTTDEIEKTFKKENISDNGLDKLKIDNINSTKDLEEAKDETLSNIDKAKNKIEKIPYEKDVKLSAIGNGMLVSGMLANYASADPISINQRVEEYKKNGVPKNVSKMLEKQSFAIPSGVHEALTGLGAHVSQNLLVKGEQVVGKDAKDFKTYLQEGNSGKTKEGILKLLLRGFKRGTVAPDDHVIANEVRSLGEMLSRQGIDLNNLSQVDKKFLDLYSRGDIKGALALIPYSDLAHVILYENAKAQNVASKALLNKAIKNLTDEDVEHIKHFFDNSSLRHFYSHMAGRNEGKYTSYETPLFAKMTQTLSNKLDKAKNNKVYKNLSEKLKNTKFYQTTHQGAQKLSEVLKRITPKPREMDLKTAQKIEEAGRWLGIATTAHFEPILAAWNVGKPLFAQWKPVSVAANADLQRQFVKGALNIPYSPNSIKGKIGNFISEYIVSPGLNRMSNVYYDQGKLFGEILRRGLPEETSKKILDQQWLREYAASPYWRAKNDKIEAEIKAYGLHNLDKALTADSPILTEKTKDQIDKTIKNVLNNKTVNEEELSDVLSATGKEFAENNAAKVAEKYSKANFSEVEQIRKANEEMNNYLNRLMAPGIVLGTGALIAPSAISNYKEYKKQKQEKNKLLHKTSSDRNNSDKSTLVRDLGIGAAGGLLYGTFSNRVDKNLKETEAEKILSNIKLLEYKNPLEAEKELEAIEKSSIGPMLLKMPEYKKLKEGILKYKNEYLKNATESKEAKKLRKMLQEMKKYKKTINIEDPHSLTRMVFQATKDIFLNGSKFSDAKGFIKDKYQRRKEIDALKRKVMDKNKQIKDKFISDLSSGELADHYNKVLNKAKEGQKLPISQILKNYGKAGFAGLGLGYVVHKASEKSNHSIYAKDDPNRNYPSDIVSYSIAGGALGTLAGLGALKVFKRFRNEYNKELIENKAIPFKQKTMETLGLNLSNDVGDEAIKQSAIHDIYNVEEKAPNVKAIAKAIESDKGKLTGKDLQTAFMLGGTTGAGIGASMTPDIAAKEKQMRRDLYKTSNEQNQQNLDNFYTYAPVVAGAASGALLGYNHGQSRKFRLSPYFEEINSEYQSLKKVKPNEFGKSGEFAKVKRIIDNLEHLKMNKYLNKEELDSLNNEIAKYRQILEEMAPYEEKLMKTDLKRREVQAKYLDKLKELNESSENANIIDKIKSSLFGPTKESEAERIRREMTSEMNKFNTDEETINKYIDYSKKMSAQQKKLNESSLNVYKTIDKNFDKIKNSYNRIPFNYTLKGTLGGLALGGLAGAYIHHDLNSNKKDQK